MSHLEERTKKCLTDGCDVRILMEGVNESCFACTDKNKPKETKEEFEARYEQPKKKCVARECRADRMEGFVVCWTHSNKNAPIVAEKPPTIKIDNGSEYTGRSYCDQPACLNPCVTGHKWCSAHIQVDELVAMTGKRDDAAKTRFDLLPPNALKEVAAVLTFGAKKYGDRNWELGLPWGKTFAAMCRHAFAWLGGEITDEESGCHHLAHVAVNAMFLLEYHYTGAGRELEPKAGR